MLDKAGGWWYNKVKIKEREEIQMNEYRIIDERTNEVLIVKAENLMDALTEATRIFAEKEKRAWQKSQAHDIMISSKGKR